MKGLDLADRPFYAARLDRRGRPAPWELGELEEFAAACGDPFGGRLLPDAPPPPFSLQLEACDDPPLWLGLDARELSAWSRALEGVWARYGLRAGECVALFDYGSSPLVLLASGSWAPYLRRGAADRLGVRVICNDGVASLAERMADIAERLRPAALVVRRDVCAPLAEVLDTAGIALREHCRWVAIAEPDGAPRSRDAATLATAWGLPVHRILRADAALMLAGECAACGAFHLDRRRYAAEPLGPDAVAVTARFGRTCAAVRHRLDGCALLAEPCAAEPEAWRLAWA